MLAAAEHAHRYLVIPMSHIHLIKERERSGEKIFVGSTTLRDNIREQYTDTFLNNAAGKVRKGTKGRFNGKGKETVYNAHKEGALPRDVIKVAALAGGAGASERYFLCKTCNHVYSPSELNNHKDHDILKHPTQKPLELSKRLILSAKPNKNGLVLVPFIGSGAECKAAKMLGMDYIGFEINEDYIKIAEHIIKETRISPTKLDSFFN